VAYFPPTDQVVVFGGAPDAQTGLFKNDTWLYSASSNSWSQGPAAPAALKARSGAAMAYDPAIGKLVLFGGAGTEWPPYGDTWYFNGTSWTQGPSAPPAMGGRVGAGMVYDDALGKLVLFAGSGTKAYNDTWLFNGTSWTAGPASPAGLDSRVFFPMSYDQTVGKVIVAGGDGALDTWSFDGTSWTPGPDMPADLGPMDRFRMVYDPQLGANVLFGGIGPAAVHGVGWLFRPAIASWIQMGSGDYKPSNRMDGQMVWVPTRDAIMLVGGESDQNDGVPFNDTIFFRDVPPQQPLTLSPTNPSKADAVTATPGAQIGGYGQVWSETAWTVNGVVVPGAIGATLQPGTYTHGDVVQAQMRLHDGLNVYGPWTFSPPVTVIDRAPVISTASVTPTAPVATDSLSAYVVSDDPDGDTVTYSYAWTVNGNPAGGNSANLSNTYFRPNDVVGFTVTPTDSFGMAGAPVTSPAVTIAYNLTIDPDAPGKKTRTQGKGYSPSEWVDIRMDSPNGSVLASWQVDGLGRWVWNTLTLPNPLSGGVHMVYGTGRTSGKVGQGTVLISPTATISPTKFSAGASVTFGGVGFVPGESVSVSFPNQQATNVVAASNGNATLTMVAPPEPNPGGNVTGSAPSGTVSVAYTVTATLTAPASGVPGTSISVGVTGYNANETVNFNLDTGAVIASGVTDTFGSLSASVPLTGYFGPHTLYAKGATSLISVSRSIPFTATLTLSPTSGPRGTVVTITSGPGWKPNESLKFYVGARVLTAKIADGTGRLNFTYTISTKDPIGPVQIKLYSALLKQTARSTFTVTG